MPIPLVLVLLAVLSGAIAESAARLLNLRALSPVPPAEFADVLDPEQYRRSQEYARASARLDFASEALDLTLLFALLLGGGFGLLDGWLRGFGLSLPATGVLFFGLLSTGREMLHLPLSAYATFGLEARFGFNTTTPRTFVLDRLKGAALAAVIGGPLLYAALWFLGEHPRTGWLWAWAVVTLVMLVVQFVAPVLILPLFNKLTPLAAGELRERLTRLAERHGYAVSGIFVMDGSRRSRRANAFLTGFGHTRRICLFDTLLESMGPAEIEAVLAHEIGHGKRGHIRRLLVTGILRTGALFGLLALFLADSSFPAALGMAPSPHAGLLLFLLLFTPISLVLSAIHSAISRRYEYEADAFAAQSIGTPEPLVTALKRLSRDNLSNLTPHPFFVLLHYSHPPVVERIRTLRAGG